MVVKITKAQVPDERGQIVFLDWGPPAGPFTGLTWAGWNDLLRAIQRDAEDLAG